MEFKQLCVFNKNIFFILILLFAPLAQAFIFDSWQWIFVKENLSKNRGATHQLFLAVKSSDKVKTVSALNQGASINARDRKGKTPLHWAVYKNDTLMAALLLHRGADPNAVNRRHRTPLHWAVLKPSNKLTRLLLEKGADPNIQDKRGWTPLHWLALKPDKRSSIRNRTSEKVKNENELPLYWNEKDLEKMRLLLTFKAHSNLKDESDNAKETNDPQFKVNLNLKDESGRTPLHYAVLNGRLEIVELLVENGADINAKDWIDETPLHLISKRKLLKGRSSAIARLHSLAIAKLLLENGADPNALNFYKISPMQFSVQNATGGLQALLSRFGGVIPPQSLCMKLFQKWKPPFK